MVSAYAATQRAEVQPLATLPMRIGEWTGRDVPLRDDLVRVAGADDSIHRRYVRAGTTDAVDVYLAHTSNPARMLGHEPDACYLAAGWGPMGSEPERLALVDGTELPCQLYRFRRGHPVPGQLIVLSYYIDSGRPVARLQDDLRSRWRLPDPWDDSPRYVAQVQISGTAHGSWHVERAEKAVRRFAAVAGGPIQALLSGGEASGPQGVSQIRGEPARPVSPRGQG